MQTSINNTNNHANKIIAAHLGVMCDFIWHLVKTDKHAHYKCVKLITQNDQKMDAIKTDNKNAISKHIQTKGQVVWQC